MTPKTKEAMDAEGIFGTKSEDGSEPVGDRVLGLVLNIMSELLVLLDVMRQINPLFTMGVGKGPNSTIEAQLSVER